MLGERDYPRFDKIIENGENRKICQSKSELKNCKQMIKFPKLNDYLLIYNIDMIDSVLII